MELESVHKYIALNKQVNGSTEVMFSGQPCLTVNEDNVWRINPVFAKLVYGANIFEDIPQCSENFGSVEEAIAAGLMKLYDLGAFKTVVDFPEDTYAATLNSVSEDIIKVALKTTDNLFEAHTKRGQLISEAKEMFALFERERSEFSANLSMSGDSSAMKPLGAPTKKFKLKSPSGTVLSTHDSESDAMNHFKSMSSSKGVKLVREENEVEVEVIVEGETDGDYENWASEVKNKFADKKIKFKGRIEKGTHTTSAEVDGEDRSYGVWDHDANKGHVFDPEEESKEISKEESKVKDLLTKYKKIATKKD